MNWEKRALALALAGGSFALGACNTTSPIPCGNALLDLCGVCTRGESDPATKQCIAAWNACAADGGSFSPSTEEQDGAVVPSSCTFDAGTNDAAADARSGDASDATPADAVDAGPG